MRERISEVNQEESLEESRSESWLNSPKKAREKMPEDIN